MTEEEIVVLVFLGIILFMVILTLIIWAIESIKLKKCEKKYPELFKLIKERDELMTKSCEFHNTNILPLCNKIDYIIENQKYMSSEKLKNSNDELEEIKLEIEKFETIHNKFLKEEDALLEKIESIIKTDKGLLKAMKKLGWCKGENK